MRAVGSLIAAAGLALACTDTPTDSGHTPPPPLPATPFVVSNPVPAPPSASTAVARAGSSGGTVIYVSLPPGTLPDGRSALVRDPHTEDSVAVAMVDGGFDPVAVGATAGDTIEVTVQGSGTGHPVTCRVAVPSSDPPIVVRTSPPPHKRDVPLNASIVVVFSEPIDGATLTDTTIRLRHGPAVVSGQLRFTDSAHTSAEFIPAAPLAESTDYELDLTKGIHDLDGDGLPVEVTVPFTTLTPGVPLPTGPFLVSQPVWYNSNLPQAFISLPPGTLPDAARFSIANARTGGSGGANFRAGGFDPVPMVAAVGDTLLVTVYPVDAAAAVQSFAAVVPATSSPSLVRSDPSPRQTDVWLNATPVLVFSEPVEFWARDSTLDQLKSAGAVVDGLWWSGGVEATFVPAVSLVPGANYEVALTQVRDNHLGLYPAAIQIPFATESPPPGPSDAKLTVQSFAMIEYRAPGSSQWVYSPELRLAETGGRSGASVVAMAFAIPLGSGFPPMESGFPPTPVPSDYALTVCSPGTPVGPWQSAVMLGEIGGTYDWVFYYPGLRAAPGQATATIVYRDDVGRTDTLTATTPVTAAGDPSVYSESDWHYEYFTLAPGCLPRPSRQSLPGAAASPSVWRHGTVLPGAVRSGGTAWQLR